MEKITRRSALSMALASPLIAAPSPTVAEAEVAEHPDTALLTLGEALNKAWAKWDAMATKSELADHPAELDAAYDAAYKACHELVKRIEWAKARTLDGLKVKARAVEWCCVGDPDGITFGNDETTDVRLAANIVRSLLNI